MKPEQIISEHAVDQLFLPRKSPKHFRVRPGDVPELRNNQIGIALLQHSRQQGKMKVLNKDERRRVARFFEDGLRKHIVDLAVRLPVASLENRPLKDVMTKGPQPLIGETVVVTQFLLTREPHSAKRETRVFR